MPNNCPCQVAKLWNEMPSHIKDAISLYNFKSFSSKWVDLNATMALVSYVRYTMNRYFISYISIDLLGYTGDYIIYHIIFILLLYIYYYQ